MKIIQPSATMTSSKPQNLQRSDWSAPSSVTLHHQQSINNKNQINVRSNNVYPIDVKQSSSKDQSKRKHNKPCKLLQCWSSTSPCIRGLLVGILTGCSILAIVLPLWLVKRPTTQTNSTVPVLRWNTTGITLAGISGSRGNSNNQLNSPTDVVFDYANNIYIADRFNNRIQKYPFGSSTAITVAGNGSLGSSQSQLNNPLRVIIDSNKNLYVSDTWNDRIQFWSDGAVSGTTVAGIGGIGNANNQLYFPFGIALDPTSGTLYIADFSNHRLMSYASGVNNGTLLLGGIGAGFTSTQLYFPTGLSFDSFSNSLVIANYAANNVVRYVLGANNWTLVAGDINGSPDVTSTRFNGPIEATFDPMGNMYVADRNNHRVQFFYNGQLNGTTIAGITGVNSSNAIALSSPWSVRLDNQLNLYVADTDNHRIQKFLRY